MNLLAFMYVAFGGAFGSMCRYALTTLLSKPEEGAFPMGTMAVNIGGSFLMGIWIACMAFTMPGRAKDLHLLFAVGALGGFTTFSSFSMDAFMLVQGGRMVDAALYIIGSVVLSIGALFAGMWVIRILAA